MKKRRIEEIAKINKDGKLSMYNGELKDFLKKNPNSKLIITYELIDNDLSAGLRGYYFGYVVPRMQRALLKHGERKTKQETDEFLRRLSPIMIKETYNEVTGRCVVGLKGISEIGNSEMMEHIDFIKQLAAEEYSVFINDPK